MDARGKRIHDTVLTELLIFLNLSLGDLEKKVWLKKLYSFPDWKLSQLQDYRLNEKGFGRSLADVCRWLDDLRPKYERESAWEDLGHKQIEHKPSKEIARFTGDYIRKRIKLETKEEKEALDKEFREQMAERWPHVKF